MCIAYREPVNPPVCEPGYAKDHWRGIHRLRNLSQGALSEDEHITVIYRVRSKAKRRGDQTQCETNTTVSCERTGDESEEAITAGSRNSFGSQR